MRTQPLIHCGVEDRPPRIITIVTNLQVLYLLVNALIFFMILFITVTIALFFMPIAPRSGSPEGSDLHG